METVQGAISRPVARHGSQEGLRSMDRTRLGRLYQGYAENFFTSRVGRRLDHKVQLILTSPPFPLNRKKQYGNYQGQIYSDWLASFAPLFRRILKPTGSIVLEIGNAWEPGRPVMSTLGLRTLLEFLERGNLFLCQQFICHNPARLPSPAQWVNIERIRLKDAYTHVWWMSPSDRPKADNREVLREYSPSMTKLLETGRYNSGKRPSEHKIGKTSFLRNNGGAIPSNVLEFANTRSRDEYLDYCFTNRVQPHPARMPLGLARFFVRFLTEPGDVVVDPFAGSNITGSAAEELGRRWVSIEPRQDYLLGALGRTAVRRRLRGRTH